MTDEEKQAIKVLNHFNPVDCGREDTQAIETILNLIEKQSKEIEELKAINKMQKYRIEVIDEREFISKDKIKAKIKEYYEYDKRMQNKPDWHTTKYYEAKVLEKLLEE